MSELFIALRCEELPARFVDLTRKELEKSVLGLLKGISHGKTQTWSTPRHIAVAVADVIAETPVVEQLVTGPPSDRAFKDGVPTKAAIGFARGKGIDVENLEVVDSARGPVIAARIRKGGESTVDRIAAGLETAILNIPFPKSMRWGAGEHAWARPIQGVNALYNRELINLSVAGIESTNLTIGHRLAASPFTITSSKEWVDGLREHLVEPDGNIRRQLIERQLHALAQEKGVELGELSLIDEVVNLVEWPVTIAGQFPNELLDLPAKLLVKSMRVHQRVFPSYTQNGDLNSIFFAVTNQPNATNPDSAALIANGNKRVLTARFYDAKFFYAEDRKKRLESHGSKLEKVRWVREGGTLAEKSTRIALLARKWAIEFDANPEFAHRAGLLSKADLTTQMVCEFPTLQGHVGRLLAAFDDEPAEVAQAIEEHYLPRFQGDALPKTQTGWLVGMADRWDTLTCCFRLGLVPKGSGDPLGLRRAANGFLLLCLHGNVSISLKNLTHEAGVDDTLFNFIIARFRAQLQENAPTDFVNAVIATGDDNPIQLAARLKALQHMAKQPDFGDFRASFKRVLGLSKDHESTDIETTYFEHEAESALFEAANRALNIVSEAGSNYDEAFAAMASLRPEVNHFFESVMVMVDDETIRHNRLSLLRKIANGFRQLADFRQLSSDTV